MAKRRKRWLWIVGVIVALLFMLLKIVWCSRNSVPSVSHGTLERFPQFASQYVPTRDVVVWLPEGYQTGDSCDVLYMHDGNMLFDATTTWNRQEWQVDEVMDSLIKAGKIRPCIVVGIYNTKDRIYEYFPAKTWKYIVEDERKDADLKKLTADAYLRFIIKELKPFIDEHYKPLTSREHTFMMGSSMGGLISLYALCEYPRVFGGAACLSTHLSMNHLHNEFNGEPWATGFLNYVEHSIPEANGCPLYMDHGTEGFDADYGKYQELLDSVIRSKGWDEQHYVSRVYQGHGHNETCWAKRLGQPLLFLLGK